MGATGANNFFFHRGGGGKSLFLGAGRGREKSIGNGYGCLSYLLGVKKKTRDLAGKF